MVKIQLSTFNFQRKVVPLYRNLEKNAQIRIFMHSDGNVLRLFK